MFILKVLNFVTFIKEFYDKIVNLYISNPISQYENSIFDTENYVLQKFVATKILG